MHPFLGHGFETGDVFSFLWSWVAKHHFSGFKQIVSIPDHNVRSFPGLTYASIENCWADWRVADGKMAADDTLREAGASFVDVPDRDSLTMLLGKDADGA